MIDLCGPFHEPVVYYVRRDGLVKIGTTRQLRTRLSAIKPDALLAAEPGGRAVERARHEQFAADRISSEWFRMSDALAAHIGQLAGGLVLPALPRYRGSSRGGRRGIPRGCAASRPRRPRRGSGG